MKRVCIVSLIAAFLTGAAGDAWAQGGFRVPDAGTQLPEVTALDAQGKPFSTKSLRDHYTVLVFGCLT